MLPTSHIDADLVSLLGPDHARQHDDTVTVSPADTEQISAILRYANKNHLNVTPLGGGTKQSWANPIQPNPVQTNILLDTTRLNRVLEHPWQDLTCTVEAGCTWSTLQQTLAQHNQFVALDPLWPDRATVGGIVATNDSGALRHRYGSLRDLIIGMTIVLADGTIAKTGGKVVKNVAGYDLHKLMTGAFGTLGIIAEVTFRLHPLPLHTQTFTVSAPQAAQLAPLIAAIRDSHLLTQALQLRGDSTGFHLDIQLNAHPDAKQDALLTAMTNTESLTLNESSKGVWQARQAICEQPERMIIKATMLPDQTAAFAQEVEEKDGGCVVQSLGIMHAALPCHDELSVRLAEEFRYHVGLGSGTTMLLSRSAQYDDCERRAFISEGELPPTLPLMQSIKQQFDPNHTLNPNRFLGGI
jgi:glycolate oxidase FAD binding subunit